MTIAIFVVLILGIVCGMGVPEDVAVTIAGASTPILLLLLFSVGIDIGSNKSVFTQIRALGVGILLIPVGVIVGSLAGGGVTALILGGDLFEGLAISSGLGWYSLSGILLTEAGHPIAGATSFLSNVFREMITFLSVPFLAKYVSHYAAIAPAGATAMDTTLGLIKSNTDAKTAVLAFISGSLCTLVVPFLLPLFLR